MLDRDPDFTILGPSEGTTLDKPWFLTDFELGRRRAEFERRYEQESVDIDVTNRPAATWS